MAPASLAHSQSLGLLSLYFTLTVTGGPGPAPVTPQATHFVTPVTPGLSLTTHAHTLPVSHTQSPSVSPARPGVTAQCSSHTFARPGRLTRRVTHSHGLTPSRPPLGRPAPQPRRGAAVQSAPQPGLGPSFLGRGSLRPPPAPHTASSAASPRAPRQPRRRAGPESRPEDLQVPGLGDWGGPVRGRRRDRTRDWGSGGAARGRAAASAAPANFLRDAGRQGAPLGSVSRWPGRGERTLDGGYARPPYLAAPRQLQLGSPFDSAPRPGSARASEAAKPARLLNESPAGPGRCAAPPPHVTAADPAPDVRALAAPPARLTPSRGGSGRSAAGRRCSTSPSLAPLGTAGGCAGLGGETQRAS